jgi:hypothetical protein
METTQLFRPTGAIRPDPASCYAIWKAGHKGGPDADGQFLERFNGQRKVFYMRVPKLPLAVT